jgi:hypothetical protein
MGSNDTSGSTDGAEPEHSADNSSSRVNDRSINIWGLGETKKKGKKKKRNDINQTTRKTQLIMSMIKIIL